MNDKYYQKYLKYKNKYISLKKNSQINNQFGGGKKGDKEVYLFKAEWCPHCIGFKPTWEKLQTDLKSKYKFITYDGDSDKTKVKEWKIEGFPTIIVKKDKDALEYLGPNEYNSLKNFIENV